ncbi:MAG TPA: hypothetical protein VGF16_13945 [Bryobacteraceae bacterium]|jgi:hypothetical protein
MERGDQPATDHELVVRLRAATEAYLNAVDQWETAFQKYYRMPGAPTVSDDVEPEQREYEARKRELAALLPRARRLCLKHQLSDPFSGLLRISLGRYAPQERVDPVIGRSERGLVAECLARLDDACRDWQAELAAAEPHAQRRSWLRRLISFFW